MRSRMLFLMAMLSAWPAGAQSLLPSTPPSQVTIPSTRRPLPAVPSKEEQAAKAAATAPKPACTRYDVARNAVYAAEIRLIHSEMPQPSQTADPQKFQQDIETAHAKYEAEARTGDVMAMRKLTAIELFVMQLRKVDAPPQTVRKACSLAALPARQRNILDPLACAVLSLEGENRTDPARKEIAKAMMAEAKGMIPTDANASNAGKLLYEDVARGLEGCI